MKIPVELEHLIRTSTPSAPPSLGACLDLIEARRNLEAEHYLRACANRLDLPDEPGAPQHADV